MELIEVNRILHLHCCFVIHFDGFRANANNMRAKPPLLQILILWRHLMTEDFRFKKKRNVTQNQTGEASFHLSQWKFSTQKGNHKKVFISNGYQFIRIILEFESNEMIQCAKWDESRCSRVVLGWIKLGASEKKRGQKCLGDNSIDEIKLALDGFRWIRKWN